MIEECSSCLAIMFNLYCIMKLLYIFFNEHIGPLLPCLLKAQQLPKNMGWHQKRLVVVVLVMLTTMCPNETHTHTHTSKSTHLYTWHSFPLRPSGITVSEGLTPRQLPDETIVLLFPSRSNGEFQLCMLKINC